MERIVPLLVVCVLAITTNAQQKTEMTDQQAVTIIKYSNAVIGLHNGYVQSLEYYAQTIKTSSDENEYKLRRNINTQPYFVDCNRSSLSTDEDKQYRGILKNVPAIPEKNDLAKLSADGLYWYDRTGFWCGRISSYFSEKKYKQDTAFAEYYIMRDSMTNAIQLSRGSWAKVAIIASNVGDRAELVLLKKNKLAVYVIPMKKDLIALQQCLDMLKDSTIQTDDIRNSLKDVKASVAKNSDIKNIDFSKLSNAYYKEVYANFYRSCTECVEMCESVLNKLDTKVPPEQVKGTYGYMKSSYNKAIESYNTFIKQ